MWEIINLIRRTIEGSVSAILLIGVVAILGASQSVTLLLADRSLASILFLLVLAIVLADLIAKLIGILSSTFPDLIPKLDDGALKRASLIRRLQPGQTIALLSGANAARIILFVVIFGLLGTSYASVPQSVQNTLFGPLRSVEATEAFMREGVAGSIGYFLFFLGADDLKSITQGRAVGLIDDRWRYLSRWRSPLWPRLRSRCLEDAGDAHHLCSRAPARA